jgi:ubiquinone/menaquinone biosynthesis C-methylase UbiE
MDDQTDPEFLSEEAYADAANLEARIRIQDRYRTHPQGWFDWLYEHLDLPNDGMLLELGSGAGDLWVQNLARLGGETRFLLTDLSPGMLYEGQRRLEGLEHFFYAAADAQHIPFPGRLFDVVLGIGLLDHLLDRQKALAEIRRVLKEGGRFVTSAGGQLHLQELERLVKPFLPDAAYGGDPDRFGLENGEGILAEFFREIHQRRYLDTLRFDRPEPILAYIVSEANARKALDETRRTALRRHIEAEIAANGVIQVRVEKGLFLGVR